MRFCQCARLDLLQDTGDVHCPIHPGIEQVIRLGKRGKLTVGLLMQLLSQSRIPFYIKAPEVIQQGECGSSQGRLPGRDLGSASGKREYLSRLCQGIHHRFENLLAVKCIVKLIACNQRYSLSSTAVTRQYPGC